VTSSSDWAPPRVTGNPISNVMNAPLTTISRVRFIVQRLYVETPVHQMRQSSFMPRIQSTNKPINLLILSVQIYYHIIRKIVYYKKYSI
jgi:hypothetical protein